MITMSLKFQIFMSSEKQPYIQCIFQLIQEGFFKSLLQEQQRLQFITNIQNQHM